MELFGASKIVGEEAVDLAEDWMAVQGYSQHGADQGLVDPELD